MNNLENRCLEFSVEVRFLIKKLQKDIGNIEDGKQVIRSSGSIGANYIEANESLGEKDRLMRLKISRKEAKETVYWLTIFERTNPNMSTEIDKLRIEADEIKKILSSIIIKLSGKK